MLDIHTHILPGVDDGSRNAGLSVRMLKCEAEQGVDAVALTPHFYARRESLNAFLARRAEASGRLEAQLRSETGMPRRLLGAETAYFGGMSRVEELDALCIGGSGFMLIELPFERWDHHVLDELVFLKEERDVTPVVAHVERYMRWQPPKVYESLCGAGILFQANASFFLNGWTRALAAHMLDKRLLHFVGSDCHNLKDRAPNLKPAMELIERKCGKSALKHLARMERKLLQG